MTESFVYALVDPETDAIRYVGISTNAPQRFANHLHEARQDTRTRKRAWIRSLLNRDLEPVFAVIEHIDVDAKTLAQLEIDYIAEYLVQGHELANLTDGGEGTWGFSAPRTEQWCKNLSAAITSHMAGLTDQEKALRSAKRVATILERNDGVYPGYTKGQPSRNKGKQLSEATKLKMKEAHKRRWERIRAEGRYDEVCANIAAGTKRANHVGDITA